MRKEASEDNSHLNMPDILDYSPTSNMNNNYNQLIKVNYQADGGGIFSGKPGIFSSNSNQLQLGVK